MVNPELDANGNLVRRRGMIVEVIEPGPAMAADLAADRAEKAALETKVQANRAALDALAAECRDIARGGPIPPDAAFKRKVCEMLARMWFDVRYDP